MGAGLMVQQHSLNNARSDAYYWEGRFNNSQISCAVSSLGQYRNSKPMPIALSLPKQQGGDCNQDLTEDSKKWLHRFGYKWEKKDCIYLFWHLDSSNHGTRNIQQRRGNIQQAHQFNSKSGDNDSRADNITGIFSNTGMD